MGEAKILLFAYLKILLCKPFVSPFKKTHFLPSR